jgi:protein-S-isoprenylcysteine O-methyltransferase Ste14
MTETSEATTESAMVAEPVEAIEAPDPRAARTPLAWAQAVLVRRRTFLMPVAAIVMLIVADPRPEMFWPGAALLALCNLLRLRCAGYIDKDNSLVRCGPYAWCRNPLYVANLGVGLAFVLICGRWEVLALIVIGWLATHIPTVANEERFLHEKFNDQFEDYCECVPRWLPRIPRIEGSAHRFMWRKVALNKEHINIISNWLVVAIFYIEMVK